ncbi:MAG: LysR family transcriptional regulator [Clostridiales bacterium]|nr:LysR family transcriptional regulator [Clostridiales bacterium]
MNFLSLEYFTAIAEEKSFTKAAERLFVSQQSLSEHVKKLEAEIGCPLFKRGRTLSLTSAGEIFLHGSRDILATRDQTLLDISALTHESSNQLTIATATFGTPPFLSDLLLQFSADYPQYRTIIAKRLVRDIASHMDGVNLYISWLPLNDGLKHCPIIDDTFAAVVSKSLPNKIYESRWPAIEAELLATRNLSLLAEVPFVYLYDRDGYLAPDLDVIFKYYSIHPAEGFQSENSDLNFSICLNGAGVYLAPLDLIRRKLKQSSSEAREAVAVYPIDTGELKATLALSYQKGHILNNAEKRFIDATRQYILRTQNDL